MLKFTPLPLLLAAALQAQAATPPGIGETLKQVKPPPVPSSKAAAPDLHQLEAPEPEIQSLPAGQATVEVKAFQFSGNAQFTGEQLHALVADAQGKTLTVAELNAVATRITRAYRTAGFFVARAYVPAQEIMGGVVRIRVVEGHYGRFILDHHARLELARAQAILDAVKDHDIVSVDTLERAMLILNDTPGVHVTRVSVSPGEQVGTSDFNVATEPTPAFAGVVAADNYGSRYTGRNRLSFNGAWDAPTQAGDRLELFAMTTGDDGLDSGRLGYSRLLTPTGLRGQAAVSHTSYALGDTYAALDATGHADTLDAHLSYPLVLTETHRLTMQAGGSLSHLVDEVRSTQTRTRKRAEAVDAGLEYSSVADGARTQAGGTLTYGHLGLLDATAAAQDATGAHAGGDFAKLFAHAELQRALAGAIVLDARARAQASLTGKSLDGSQKLEITGSDGVMAYAPGEALGDTAAVAHVALGRRFELGGVTLTPQVFVDEGWSHNRFAVAGTAASRTLGDAGLGAVAAWKSVSLSMQWAARTQGGRPTAEPTASHRVSAQLSASF